MRHDLAALARGVSRLARLPFVMESTAREQERRRRERAASVEAYDLDPTSHEDEESWAVPPARAAPEHHTPQSA